MEFSDLHDQFLLSQKQTRAPEGWLVRRHAGWMLISHPKLRVTDIWIEGARPVLAGWIIGDAITVEGTFLDVHVKLDSARDLESQTVERYLVTLGGRFACAIVLPSSPRFYVDAGACLSAVYSAHDRVVASTVTLVDIQKHGKATFIQANDAFPADIPNRFFPAGLTCNPEVARVLPNHYLDLSTWRTMRYWPTGEIERAAPQDVGDLVARIVSTARKTLAAAAQRYPICFGLTGGRDSRMLLACSRDIIDRCNFITFDFRAVRGRHRRYAVDVHLARTLARRFGLRHRILRLEPATEDEKAAYLRRIGYAGHWGKSQDLFGACMRNCNLDSAYIHGFAGEVGRAFYWPSRAKPRDQITPDGLLARMSLPTLPVFEKAMADWISCVPEGDSHFLLDLLYLEQRLACWACPHLYGSAPFSLQLIPLAHRSIFDAMLRLPVEYRRQQYLARDVIQCAWPELGTVPFHEFTGARRAAQYLIDASTWLLASWRASRSARAGVLA